VFLRHLIPITSALIIWLRFLYCLFIGLNRLFTSENSERLALPHLDTAPVDDLRADDGSAKASIAHLTLTRYAGSAARGSWRAQRCSGRSRKLEDLIWQNNEGIVPYRPVTRSLPPG
jgi:hypothetical protein